MSHSAALVFEYDSSESAHLVEQSVGQEVGDIEGDRTRATLERDGRELTASIDADDLVALRAGINTWSTLIEVAERVAGVPGA